MKLCGAEIGLDRPFFLIAGPCVIESRELAFDTAGALKELTDELGIHFIYKSSFDKANRSSGRSYRGPGQEEGLRILADVREQLGVPVLTDVHTTEQVAEVASVVDVLQTPVMGSLLPTTLTELAELLSGGTPTYSVSGLTFGGKGFDSYSFPCQIELWRIAPRPSDPARD